MAGLEGRRVAGRGGVEEGDGTQDGVGVHSVSCGVGVDCCRIVLAVPVRLEEAEDLRSLSTGWAGDAEGLGEGLAFDQRAVLGLGGEE